MHPGGSRGEWTSRSSSAGCEAETRKSNSDLRQHVAKGVARDAGNVWVRHLSSSYGRRALKWGSQRFSNLSKATQLLRSVAGIRC